MPDHISPYSEAEVLLRERRFKEAFQIYNALANAGDLNCQVMAGWMYYEGLGVQKDKKKALEWFEGAAKLGSKVGAFYCGKHAIMSERYGEALKWLSAASSQEFGPALLWLGLTYVRGLGVPVDLPKGVSYLRRAAKAGNFLARRELSLLMIRGKLGILRIPVGLILFPTYIFLALSSEGHSGYSEKLMG